MIFRSSHNNIKEFSFLGVCGFGKPNNWANSLYRELPFFYGFFNWFFSFGTLLSFKKQSRTNRNHKLPRGRKSFVKYLNTNPCAGEPSNMAFDNLIISI